jgi:hypothetical protein
MSAELEFYIWLDSAPMNGLVPFPAARALKAIAAQSVDPVGAALPHGRVTLWLWKAKGKKLAFAMARKAGDGGDKPIRVVHDRAPPYRDADKAEFVYLQERK